MIATKIKIAAAAILSTGLVVGSASVMAYQQAPGSADAAKSQGAVQKAIPPSEKSPKADEIAAKTDEPKKNDLVIAVRSIYQTILDRQQQEVETSNPNLLYVWSKRILEEQSLESTEPNQLAHYIQEHVDRMKSLSKTVAARYEIGRVKLVDKQTADFYVLEAEHWLANAKEGKPTPFDHHQGNPLSMNFNPAGGGMTGGMGRGMMMNRGGMAGPGGMMMAGGMGGGMAGGMGGGMAGGMGVGMAGGMGGQMMGGGMGGPGMGGPGMSGMGMGGMAGGPFGGPMHPGREEKPEAAESEIEKEKAKEAKVPSFSEERGKERNHKLFEKLDMDISMPFPNATPLEKVLSYVVNATKDKEYKGIPIYLDPEGLAEAEKTPASTIVINIEGVPLRASLALALRQLGLRYFVTSGMIVVTSRDANWEDAAEDGPFTDPSGE